MTDVRFSGYGRKRPQVNKPVSLLHLDSQNPRLPEEAQGKSEEELLNVLYKEFYLDELADSMAENGYFDAEPLVAVPHKLPSELEDIDPNSKEFQDFINRNSTELIVVEGNRRLATARLLLDLELREKLRIKHWPSLSEQVADDLRILPVIVYLRRSEVTPYLGVRHIMGIQKWDSYAKARYIVQLTESGLSIKQVQEQIGDKQRGSTTQSYVAYKLLEQVENEFDFDTRRAKRDFSLLLLAIGQGNIKRFLGLPRRLAEVNPDEPVATENLDDLRVLVTWIFGDGKKERVITDSRLITNRLSHIVNSAEAVSYLERTGDLEGAYERTDGEEKMLLKYLSTANLKLEGALGVAHRHKTPEVISEAEKCEQTIKALLKIVRSTDD
ncbi:MAG: hypothetical protein DDT34_01269 [Firmicutes bacterium]|nr:hypothetical protein [Bacillota bacterium]MBT9165695.1 hypothetical protein [Chloroflexota bacterium]